MHLAQRRSLIDSSGIRRVFDLAARMENPINLSIGQPDFDVPEAIQDALVFAVRAGKNRYTLTAGIPSLRSRILAQYSDGGIPVEAAMVSSGTSGALVLLFMVLLDPGDEVIVPDPYFVMYKHLVRMVGGVPVFADTYPDFRLTRERLEAALTPRSRVLVLNSPSNPTGLVYTREEARLAADFAQEHGLWLVSDEIYDRFVFDGPHVSPAAFHPRPIIVSGLSKTIAMTGWRLGWIAGPEEVIKAATEFQQYTFVCAPSMVQEAALHALDYDVSDFREEYIARRDLIYEGLIDAGFEAARPGGAFYIFPKAPNGDGQAFVEEAVKERLLMVPGNVFSERNTHFRISFAASREKLAEGIQVLRRLAERHRQPARA